ncbi:hypothetical protein EDB81DRAFT_28640 [Dactylonectria macrodidyma]|uniref:Uncharacterized protein n=1 Tax=Dactylonectria macrodidyma TaxID=307937 RepID=A0A9P9FUQ4_9HYPO|nr:hypothetical protein EDB81DRAFT_28640 [Dactylonectria macrodidyma]
MHLIDKFFDAVQPSSVSFACLWDSADVVVKLEAAPPRIRVLSHSLHARYLTCNTGYDTHTEKRTKPKRSDGKPIGCFRTMHALVRRRYVHAWRPPTKRVLPRLLDKFMMITYAQFDITIRDPATENAKTLGNELARLSSGLSPDFKKALASLVWPPRSQLHLHTPALQLARFPERTHSHRHSSRHATAQALIPVARGCRVQGSMTEMKVLQPATCSCSCKWPLDVHPSAPPRDLQSPVWLLFAEDGCNSTFGMSTLALMRRRIIFEGSQHDPFSRYADGYGPGMHAILLTPTIR